MASPQCEFGHDTAVAHCFQIVCRTMGKGISWAFVVEQPEMLHVPMVPEDVA